MTNTFSEAMLHESNLKTTENGALAYSHLDNPVLTLFGQIGSLRKRDEQEICDLFSEAYAFDPELAVKMLFYAGNIRGGLGERRTFKILLKWLAEKNYSLIVKNIQNIPFYNRWDSLYSLIGTAAEGAMWSFVREQLEKDIQAMKENKPCSLLAKWLKSTNSTSKKSNQLGRLTAKKLGFKNEMEYRKMLSSLRSYIRVTEKDMSRNEWKNIQYSTVPSYAMKNYRNAFDRHDHDRFASYIAKVNTGEERIHADTLFPYDLARNYFGGCRCKEFIANKEDAVTETQWKALPDYLNGDDSNVLCMVDISGSMTMSDALSSAVGLGIYFAQHNHGAFHNQMISFSTNPDFISIRDGESLYSCIKEVLGTRVDYSTDLEAAFDLLLNTAVKYNISEKDMPSALVILSDCEIDCFKGGYCRKETLDLLAVMRKRFAAEGYELPKLVFYQVEARQSTFLTMSPDALFVSGNSAATFKQIIENLTGTAWDLVLNTLNDPIYDRVVTK